MCGLRETTADLDLCVSIFLFKKLREKYNLKEEDKNDCCFYRISEKVEIVPSEKSNFTMMEVDEYYIENLRRILNFKKSRNIPKDQSDLTNIENYLNKYN